MTAAAAASQAKARVGRLLLLLAFVIAVAVAALAGTSRPAHATFPGANGVIGFSSDQGTKSFDIYTMNPDGSGLRSLTSDNNSGDFYIDWTPDGSKAVFGRRLADQNREIFSINADGSELRRLTDTKTAERFPAWTADGTHIVFASNRNDANPAKCISPFSCNYDLFVMAADGSDVRQLTSGPAADFFPAVSPDGSAIAFQSNRSGSPAVWTMSADGSIKGQLTPDSLKGGKPNWSPNGKKIVFENNGCNTCSNSDVFVINSNGAGIVRLTSDFGNNIEAVWSPDGKKIAFSHNEGPTPDFFQPEDIYVMNANGTGITNVTQSPAVDDCCAGWRPL